MIAINVSSKDAAALDLPNGQWPPRLDSRREQNAPLQGRVTLPRLAAWLAYR